MISVQLCMIQIGALMMCRDNAVEYELLNAICPALAVELRYLHCCRGIVSRKKATTIKTARYELELTLG